MGNNNNNENEDEYEYKPRIELILSRSSYRAGGTIVGTVRLIPPRSWSKLHYNSLRGDINSNSNSNSSNNSQQQQSSPSSSPPPQYFKKAMIYLAGRFRADPRWHDTSSTYKTRGGLDIGHPLHRCLPNGNIRLYNNFYINNVPNNKRNVKIKTNTKTKTKKLTKNVEQLAVEDCLGGFTTNNNN